MSMITLTFDGVTGGVESGTTLRDAARVIRPGGDTGMLAALDGGVCVELNQKLTNSASLHAITYQHEEGRRIYERTLRFLFMLAAKELFPDRAVRVLNSVGYGVYVRIMGMDVSHEQALALEKSMRDMVLADLSIEKEIWPREKAMRYFESVNQPASAALMRDRKADTIVMYGARGMYDYYYGAMLPSAGYCPIFAIKPHYPGLVIQYPSPKNETIPAPYIPRPKHLRVFEQSRRWCGILGVDNVCELNQMIRSGDIRPFIRVNEALHDRSIAHIADEILKRGARIVLIFGPSSSGKTTFCHRLAVHLRVLGLRPKQVSLDDYYRPRSEAPLDENGKPDLESIGALDVPLLTECLETLMAGREAQMPRFSFKTGRREEKRVPMTAMPDEPLLLEGIHAMDDAITRELPEQLVYGVYVSALPCLNLDDHNRIRTTDVRLLRRIVRDARTRGTPLEETIEMWPSVRQGEEKWIFPNQEKADIMFNTSLHYELPVLKRFIYDELSRVSPEKPTYLVARRLMKFLNYIEPVATDALREIPPTSILREFIGESTLYDNH